MQQELTFTLTIDSHDMVVHYRPRFFATADYAHFEFTSPHEPRRRIPVSETGYRSHFAPMHEIEAAASVEDYARMLVMALMNVTPCLDEADEDDDDDGGQLALF